MRATAFETSVPCAPITALPLSLTQTPSRSAPVLTLALACPAALAALAPYYLMAAHAAAQNSSLFVERIEASTLLTLALILWSALFGWPIVRRLTRIGICRQIAISSASVDVTERGPFMNRAWTEPLTGYTGLAHHISSSLSGTRHELLLVHPNPARSLLLRAATTIGQNEIDQAARVLGCREIAPQVFYRRNTRSNPRPFAATATA